MDSRLFEEIGCDELPPHYCSGCGEELDECACNKESVMLDFGQVERVVVAFEKLCDSLVSIAADSRAQTSAVLPFIGRYNRVLTRLDPFIDQALDRLEPQLPAILDQMVPKPTVEE